MTFAQQQYDIRCEWGLRGAEVLAPVCDAMVVVDVLSFTTAVSVAVNRGGVVSFTSGRTKIRRERA